MKKGFRQSQTVLHTWSGVLPGWVLFIVFVTGTAAYWREALDRWMRPEAPRIERPVETLNAALHYLEIKAPNAQAWALAVPTADVPGVTVTWTPQAAAANNDHGGEQHALLDGNGSPIIRATRGGDFFFRFHFDLHYLPTNLSNWIVGIATLMALVAILTGIVAHKRIFRDFFTLRRGRGQRSWLDGHNAVGVLALPFHLMITYTGLVALATMLMPWAIIANYDDGGKLIGQLFPSGPVIERAGRPAPMANLVNLVIDGQRRLGGPVGYLEISHPGDAAARVTMTGASRGTLSTYGSRLVYDGVSGQFLWRSPASDGAFTTYGAMIGLQIVQPEVWKLSRGVISHCGIPI